MTAPFDRIDGRRVVASISGGRDSAAMSLWLTENGIKHDRVFADTGWEHPAVYEYLRGPLTAKLGPIIEVRGKRPFADLVRDKGIFPDRTKRFCTTELKVKPILAYIDSLDEDVVNAIGIRREESIARSRVPEWEDSAALLVEVWRPIVTWSVADVVAIHRRHGLQPNPLYALGASRVGCWPCIYSSQRDIVLTANIDPERIALLRELEREVNDNARARFELSGEQLKWMRAMFSVRESQQRPDAVTGIPRRHHRPMPIDEAVAWARAGVARKSSEEPPMSCGEWGFCEP